MRKREKAEAVAKKKAAELEEVRKRAAAEKAAQLMAQQAKEQVYLCVVCWSVLFRVYACVCGVLL